MDSHEIPLALAEEFQDLLPVGAIQEFFSSKCLLKQVPYLIDLKLKDGQCIVLPETPGDVKQNIGLRSVKRLPGMDFGLPAAQADSGKKRGGLVDGRAFPLLYLNLIREVEGCQWQAERAKEESSSAYPSIWK